ncbi:aldo/keto reductase [Corynebacterium callunae]|uniref:aldo/keto reductase n=1 Tax=Corynebacterium callunae TaxID=1721 RepID=UPI003981F458
MIFEETYSLSNGVDILKLGLGTWFIDDDKAAAAVESAIHLGYRNIDTAQAYGNERGVGEGLRSSGINREAIFLSTKLAAEIKDYDAATAAIDESLGKLGVEYVDLFLIHSPQPWADFRGGDYKDGNLAAWRALEDAYEAGKARAIGVSNFQEADINNLLENASVTPHVNQILVHAGNTPSALIDFCQNHDIVVQAYSPIAHGAILDNPAVITLAEKYQVSVPQLCIRYTIQLGTVSLPKTANPDHMRENAQLDFEISAADMETLKNLEDRDYGEFSVFPVYNK